MVVPADREEGTLNYGHLLEIAKEFRLGQEAYTSLANKGSELRSRVRPIIVRYATNNKGEFVVRWQDMTSIRREGLVALVHEVAPWLAHFEEGWASDWVLSRMISQRFYDRNRPENKDKSKRGKLVIH